MKKYQIIYADPPWNMVRSFGGANWKSGERKRPLLDYSTMTIKEIKSLPINSIANNDCNLYLWTTQKYLPFVFDIIEQWRFRYIFTLVWCKPKGGFVGGAFFSNVEYLLYCRRGKAGIKEKINSQWFCLPKGKHSEKPKEIRDIITKVHGDVPRIELFAREKTPGWDVWGNEVDSDIQLTKPLINKYLPPVSEHKQSIINAAVARLYKKENPLRRA